MDINWGDAGNTKIVYKQASWKNNLILKVGSLCNVKLININHQLSTTKMCLRQMNALVAQRETSSHALYRCYQ